MKRISKGITVFCTLLVLLGGSVAQGRAIPVDGYAAMVNDRVITVGDVLAFIAPVEEQLQSAYEGDELEDKLKEAFETGRETLIERALILEDFESQEVNLPDRVVDNYVNKIIHEQFGDDRAAFLAALARDRITLDEWREQIKDRYIIMAYRNQNVDERVVVAPMAVYDLYRKRIEKYSQPETVKLSMIMINKGSSLEDRKIKLEEAEQVLKRLQDGADFATVAKEVSEGGRASRGGDWGWTDPTTLRSELAAAAQATEPGAVSEIIETPDAYFILTIEGRKKSSVVPFDDVRKELEMELRRVETERIYDEWIERLRAKHYIKIY